MGLKTLSVFNTVLFVLIKDQPTLCCIAIRLPIICALTKAFPAM